MESGTAQKCAHPTCQCEVNSGDEYCGSYCREVGDRDAQRCGCGHEDCAEKEKP